MKLYSYWRSGTSYRVRLALAIKSVPYTIVPVNLLDGEHRGETYRQRNPQGLVPTLELDDGRLLSQSPAIIEYIDDVFEGPKLFPEDPYLRGVVRQFAALIGCDTHPLQNLRVLKRLRDPLGHSQDEAFAWAAHWIEAGFEALEAQAAPFASQGPYLTGAVVSAADCYLLPQIYAGRRFGAALECFPRLLDIEAALSQRTDVRSAHPDQQIDAPKDL